MHQSTSTPSAEGGHPKGLSLARKLVLLLVFSFAQFLEAFNNAALFPAIPTLQVSMKLKGSQCAWIISGFQLTYASFLLISGRMSDIYNPKSVFITGVAFLGILSTVAGFVDSKIALILLRAFMGIASAMSIPSALVLLVHVFPEPAQQARAIAVFGGFGAVADVLGFFVGAVLVKYASYHWVFWVVAIVSIPVALVCVFIIPTEVGKSENTSGNGKWKNLDLTGISILTVSFILFIYALTSGSVDGWVNARVLTLLVVSILFTCGFFYWEAVIPSDKAAIPPGIWFCENFSVLFGSALLPFFWWNAIFIDFTTLWQDVFHWTTISTVLHMLPIGIAAFVMGFTGPLSRTLNPKWFILVGLSMVSVATALLAVGSSQLGNYWPYVFPAFTLGSAGTMLVCTHANIAIFQVAPTPMAGTVSAIFNGALQFGSAIGLAAFTSIETSVNDTGGNLHRHQGRAAAFWFLLGIVLVELISVSYFYRNADQSQPRLKGDVHDNVNVASTSGEKAGKGDKAKKNASTVPEEVAYRVSLSGPDCISTDTLGHAIAA